MAPSIDDLVKRAQAAHERHQASIEAAQQTAAAVAASRPNPRPAKAPTRAASGTPAGGVR